MAGSVGGISNSSHVQPRRSARAGQHVSGGPHLHLQQGPSDGVGIKQLHRLLRRAKPAAGMCRQRGRSRHRATRAAEAHARRAGQGPRGPGGRRTCAALASVYATSARPSAVPASNDATMCFTCAAMVGRGAGRAASCAAHGGVAGITREGRQLMCPAHLSQLLEELSQLCHAGRWRHARDLRQCVHARRQGDEAGWRRGSGEQEGERRRRQQAAGLEWRRCKGVIAAASCSRVCVRRSHLHVRHGRPVEQACSRSLDSAKRAPKCAAKLRCGYGHASDTLGQRKFKRHEGSAAMGGGMAQRQRVLTHLSRVHPASLT